MSELLTSIPKEEIKNFVVKQTNNMFPDNQPVPLDDQDLNDAFTMAFERTAYCFEHITINGYTKIDENGVKHPYFEHTNSDQYCQFLYFLSNSLWKINENKKYICDKLILLNKALHACWYTYKVNLPDIFILVHPVGSVIGHAVYRNFLVVCQNVTIGERIYATEEIGEYCFLATGCTIMGTEKIGKCVSIGVNTTLFRKPLPDNCVYYFDEELGKNITKQNKANHCRAQDYFC